MDEGAARLEFLAHAEELTDALYEDLRLLRSARAGRTRRALIDRAFRHAHTLKGSAAASPSAEAVVRLAHGLEDLLDAARAGRLSLDAATLDACESAADSLSHSLERLARGARPVEAEIDEPAERLRALLREAESRADASENSSEAAVAQALESLPHEVAAQLNAAEGRRLAAAVAEGARVVSVRVAFDLEHLDEGFRRLGDALEEKGEIVATLPGGQGDDAQAVGDADARVSLRIVCATDESPDKLARGLAEFGAEVEPLFDAGASEVSSAAGSLENESGTPAEASPPEFVRVPLAELEELAFTASELFDDAAAALEAARANAAATARDGAADLIGAARAGREATAAEFEWRAARLREDFLALEERVLSLRMQPLAPALERAARAGRAASRAAGKEVEIVTAGGPARVDRAVAERVVEPLVHLLRNAVDHGIEPAVERRAAGKPERGRVCLRASAEGASVRVRVEDDGRGIDPTRVERAARESGIIPEGARVTREQALRLIFRPGFSTAEAVTETSGRGVGLDAVERAVERAGGEVRVRTSAGRGTTFELRLPLALALLPVVLVESGGETYAVDAARVVETARLERAAITRAGATSRALWRGRELPFVTLSALTGRATDATTYDEPQRGDGDDRVPVLVVRSADADARSHDERRQHGGDETDDTSVERADAAVKQTDSTDKQALASDEQAGAADGGAGRSDEGAEGAALFAVAVDRVAGRRDALVRGLGRHATRWRGVGGAIDLRDGTVALLLDLSSLIDATTGEESF